MVNNTTILTNEKFNINSVNLDFNLINKKSKFDNIDISYSDKKSIENIQEHEIKELTYGLGETVFKNNIKYNNHKIVIDNKRKEEIKIVYNFDKNNDKLANYININANNDAHITIVYKSNTIDYNLLNSILKINVAENKIVVVDIINLLNNDSNSLVAIESTLENKAKITFNVIDLGSKNNISNIYIKAKGENSIGKINTIYLGRNKEFKDINYIAHLIGKNVNIDINVEGALNEESRKNFKGTIDFKKGCIDSKGSESEICTLLSPNTISKSLPILLCTEEDVDGTHSSASGKIEEDKIYYIMSRGIDRNEAIKIIMKAKFNKIIEKIKDEVIKNEIIEVIERKLD